jgi:hypothetical protein
MQKKDAHFEHISDNGLFLIMFRVNFRVNN